MDVNRQIKFLAKARTKPLPTKWEFIPDGKLLINNRDYGLGIGRINYDNPLILIDSSIKVDEWVFDLESSTDARFSAEWYVTGFRHNVHYSFAKIEPERGSGAHLWHRPKGS